MAGLPIVRYNSAVRALMSLASTEATLQHKWPEPRASRLAAETVRTRWPAVILILHFIIGVIYSVATPIWDAQDEVGHYPYVQYVATHWALPRMIDQESRGFSDQTHQPPLYYILGAIATAWIDTSYSPPQMPNVHARDGTGLHGYNLYVHTDAESFPWRGTVAGIHVARLVSVLVTTGTVWITYRIGRRLCPDRPGIALGAMAVNAFLPQFLFIGSIVNNDSLISFTSSVALLAALHLIEKLTPRWLIIAGVALGCSLLTKNSGLALIPFLALTVLIAAYRQRASWRRLLLSGLVVFGLGALLSAPWYVYNWINYGRLITDRADDNPILQTPAPITQGIDEMLSLDWMARLLRNTFRSYWGAFGWGNIVYPDQVYTILAIITIIGLSGALVLFLRRSQRRHQTLPPRLGLALIIMHAILIALLALYRAVYFKDPMLVPGRYLLPAVSGLSLLLFAGWAYWIGPTRILPLAAIGGALLAGFALVTPWTTIGPAYARPPILKPDEVHIAHPVSLHFGDRIELLGYELEPERVNPGEILWVTLYWRAKLPMSKNYTVGIHLLDGNFRDWGQFDTFPGRGNYATSLWKPGEIIRDTYPVRLSSAAEAPAMGQIAVGVQLYPDGVSLPVTDAEGRNVTPIFGRFKIAANSPAPISPIPPVPIRFQLAQHLALIGIEVPQVVTHPGDTVQVRLTWWVLANLDKDYTAFVHAADGGTVRFQTDRPPIEGAYPTSLWDPGEQITDVISLTIPIDTPAGTYRLTTGLYDPETEVRIPAYSPDGQRQPVDAIPLGVITVAP